MGEKALKGFDENMMCRGFSYEEGKSYELEEGSVIICERGFHAIRKEYSPLEVFGYYPPSTSRYCEVDLDGDMDYYHEKIVGSKIRIDHEIGIDFIVKKSVKQINSQIRFRKSGTYSKKDATGISNAERESIVANMGNMAQASSEASRSVAASTGDNDVSNAEGILSVAACTGSLSIALTSCCGSIACNIGNRSVAKTAGTQSIAAVARDSSVAICSAEMSIASSTGDESLSMVHGDCSVAVSNGHKSNAIVDGDRCLAVSTGNRSQAEAAGNESIAIVTGVGSKVRGEIGNWLVIAEYDKNDIDIVDVKSFKVDGETVKADTWYTMKNGVIKEVK